MASAKAVELGICRVLSTAVIDRRYKERYAGAPSHRSSGRPLATRAARPARGCAPASRVGQFETGAHVQNSRARKWETVSAARALWSATRLSRRDPGQHDRMAKLRASATWDTGLQSVRRTSRADARDVAGSRSLLD